MAVCLFLSLTVLVWPHAVDGTLKIQLLASLFFFLNCSNSLFVTHAIYVGRRSEQKNENEIIRLAEIRKLDFPAIGKDTGLPGSR